MSEVAEMVKPRRVAARKPVVQGETFNSVQESRLLQRLVRIESRLVKLARELNVDVMSTSDAQLVQPLTQDAVGAVAISNAMVPFNAIYKLCKENGISNGVVEVIMNGQHIADVFV